MNHMRGKTSVSRTAVLAFAHLLLSPQAQLCLLTFSPRHLSTFRALIVL